MPSHPTPSTAPVFSSRLGAHALNRLRWRCRRGLLENDLFLARFFARHEATLTERHAQGLYALMELADNDLLDLLLRRREPAGEPGLPAGEQGTAAREVLDMLRQSGGATAPHRQPPFQGNAHHEAR